MTRCPSFPSPNPGKKRAINCHKLTWREGGSYFSLKDGTNVPLNGDTEDRGKIIHDGSAIGANRFPVPWNESIVRRARRKGEKGVERGDVSAELSIVNCTAREEERERGRKKGRRRRRKKNNAHRSCARMKRNWRKTKCLSCSELIDRQVFSALRYLETVALERNETEFLF